MDDRCNVLMIFPKFNPNSFWGYRATYDAVGVRSSQPPLGLMTVAAMLPDTSLVQMRKKQNTGRDLAGSVHRIHAFGIAVVGGFIVGFDSETASVSGPIIRLIEDAAIPVAMAGLLYALPETQLTRRLASEGRLFEPERSPDEGEVCGDPCTAGLNFVTHRSRRDILDDYRRVVATVYAPAAFFGRLEATGQRLRPPTRPIGTTVRMVVRDARRVAGLLHALSAMGPEVRRAACATIGAIALRNPRALPHVLKFAALYLHLGPFSRYVVARIDGQIRELDEGAWVGPEVIPAALPALARAG